jgi:4-hydroxythreonine-4-phosphate dehydrogenase
MRPVIALTTGEPAGVGPELCVAAAQRYATDPRFELALVGDPSMLAARGAMRAGTVIDGLRLAATSQAGRLDPANAKYVLATLDRAMLGLAEGRYAAMVTAPVHKGVINDAGIAFTGHTEYLAERSGAPQVAMMLAGGGMRVALATTHLPLAAVPAALTMPGLVAILRIVDGDLRKRFGCATPRILVCGLNPHAGEGGHLGREEIDVIEPAIAEAKRLGIDARGPYPADTLFQAKHLKHADCVLAMYHDQGLPVLKYASFGHGVNITLGLPFIRTSVDHGTALDLAGTGKADPGSLFAAIELAAELAARRAA